MELSRVSTFPEKILRKRCAHIQDITEAEKAIFYKMLHIMKLKKCAGIASPQAGFSRKLIAIDIGGEIVKLVNPEIIQKSGFSEIEEGCISIPDRKVKIKRAHKIVVAGLDHMGKKVEIQAEGTLAGVFQHEIDHLNGKLIIDYLGWWERIKASFTFYRYNIFHKSYC